MSDKQKQDQAARMAELSQQYLYPPSRAAMVSMEEFKRRAQASHRMTWGVPVLDDVLTPMMPGDLVSILGRPGHAKTSFLIATARQGSRIAKDRTGDDEWVSVYVTWETMVEEFVGLVTASESGQPLSAIARGEADLAAVESAVVRSIGDRIYVIGQSISRLWNNPSKQTRLTIPVVCQLLDQIVSDGKRIAILCMDYLQRIPSDAISDPVARVARHTDDSKNIAMFYGTPVLLAVQSRRDTDTYEGLKFPTMSDGQWSSTIEQDADKLLSITRPSLYLPTGSTVKLGDQTYVVTEELLAAKCLKQRWADAGMVLMLSFDPRTLALSDASPIGEGEGIAF
jgi:replicative DNA helicase